MQDQGGEMLPVFSNEDAVAEMRQRLHEVMNRFRRQGSIVGWSIAFLEHIVNSVFLEMSDEEIQANLDQTIEIMARDVRMTESDRQDLSRDLFAMMAKLRTACREADERGD
jgi:hypothetical protein